MAGLSCDSNQRACFSTSCALSAVLVFFSKFLQICAKDRRRQMTRSDKECPRASTASCWRRGDCMAPGPPLRPAGRGRARTRTAQTARDPRRSSTRSGARGAGRTLVEPQRTARKGMRSLTSSRLRVRGRHFRSRAGRGGDDEQAAASSEATPTRSRGGRAAAARTHARASTHSRRRAPRARHGREGVAAARANLQLHRLLDRVRPRLGFGGALLAVLALPRRGARRPRRRRPLHFHALVVPAHDWARLGHGADPAELRIGREKRTGRESQVQKRFKRHKSSSSFFPWGLHNLAKVFHQSDSHPCCMDTEEDFHSTQTLVITADQPAQ